MPGQAFLVTFVVTDKSNSPVKGETLSHTLSQFASSPVSIQSPFLQTIKNAAEAALHC
jgi:hypothetical protein